MNKILKTYQTSHIKNLLLLATIIFSYSAIAQTNKTTRSRPKLVVGIVVDQMRPDYITRYWSKLSPNGFKALIKDGYEFKNANYNFIPTYTGPGHASIYTGTTPSINGIISNDWYIRKENDTVYCVQDDTIKTVGSNSKAGQMSPHRLLTTTVTDELQLATNGNTKVIGISLKDRGAILPAGRGADAAYWYDGSTGTWISSTWYMQSLPTWLTDFNSKKYADQYLTKPWVTLNDISTYTESEPDNSPYEMPFKGETTPTFPHDFPKIKDANFELVRRSPYGNTLTKDLALAAIDGEHLGEDAVTDFLAVSFSSTDYVGHQFGTQSIEVEDTYLRLDLDLANFISALNEKVGKGNYLLFLTADHGAAHNPQFMIDKKLAAGIVNNRNLNDIINTFLNAKYGNKNYLPSLNNDQIFFNDSLLEANKIDKCALETELANYLLKNIDGLDDALTACNLSSVEYKESFRSMVQRGYNRQASGDICLLFSAGWTDWLYGNGHQGTTHGAAYSYDTHVPLLFYGWGINKGATSRYVTITDIAPSISMLLNISSPSGVTGVPLIEITK